ncbi:unnamed protein product [Notodromas monacha]|uniref:Hikeshi-like domain-containing protein n=1 Tax=Notodromas monacha TaxID=399045 RepID=A0A7R9BTP3_9CRUS|nr:unnamed protein product [Notodromas monacha]CAG0921546.1 unnamed protein product [Notodromas monacha]
MAMFGVLVSGRLAQTDFVQADPTHFLLTINDADNINYVVVFMTGTTPFPDDMGGGVYFSWPSAEAPPQWQYLGQISNEKPSAIFRISRLKSSGLEASSVPVGFGQKVTHNAQIGISLEPLQVLRSMTPAVETSAELAAVGFVEFTQRMLESFLNFVTSFSQTQGQMSPAPNEIFVPLSYVQTWYQNFERRLAQNVYFWKN